ncbi:hypothetical protein M9458_041717, partial [Cirrhinus mrigala]
DTKLNFLDIEDVSPEGLASSVRLTSLPPLVLQGSVGSNKQSSQLPPCNGTARECS